MSRVARVGDSSREVTTTMAGNYQLFAAGSQVRGDTVRAPVRPRVTGIRGAGGGGGTGTAAAAAATSMRPQPKTGFGIAEPGTPPQTWSEKSLTAVARRSSSVSATRPASDGTADQRSATAPATWGEAIEVPESRLYAPVGTEDRIETPGATTSGFIRFEPSTVTGPRLLKLAMVSASVVAPRSEERRVGKECR